jgi:hypothetical protein
MWVEFCDMNITMKGKEDVSPKEIHNNGAIIWAALNLKKGLGRVNGWYLKSGGRETYIFSFADIDVISWVVSSGGALFLTIKNNQEIHALYGGT